MLCYPPVCVGCLPSVFMRSSRLFSRFLGMQRDKFYTIFIALRAILGLFVASNGPKTTFISNFGLIVGKDSTRVTDMGMKTAINPKPGHYMNCSKSLNNIQGAVLASRCITDLNQQYQQFWACVAAESSVLSILWDDLCN